MPLKIKLIVGVLSLAAVLSLVKFFTSIDNNPFAVLGKSSVKATPLPQPGTDADHDGLSDAQEAYWNTNFQNSDTDGDGYMDGIEIITGHDPRIKGPNDLLSQGKITDINSLITAGIYEGSLIPKKSKDIDKAVKQVSDQALQNSLNQINSYDEIILDTVSDSDINLAQYKNDMAYPNLEIGKEIAAFIKFIDLLQTISKSTLPQAESEVSTMSSRLDLLIMNLKSIQVPESKLAAHLKLITSLEEAVKSYSLLLKSDVTASAMAFITLNRIYFSELQKIGN